ncbi:MIP family channel protein [Xylariales sp. AK1849]|nr:MIP family channel protein [Xylariales sp. AK1849]
MSTNLNMPFTYGIDAKDSAVPARTSAESSTHRGQRAESRANQRGSVRSANPPPTHGRSAADTDPTGQQGPKKHIGFGNNGGRTSSVVSDDSYNDNQQSPTSNRGYSSHANGRSGNGYGDLERGYGHGPATRVVTNDTVSPGSEKALNRHLEDGDDAYHSDTRPARPALFSRTFTQQIRRAGEEEPEAPNFKHLSKQEKREMMRLPWFYLMDTNFKNHTVAALGEFVGTTMFLFFAFTGTGVAKIPTGTGSDTTTAGATGFDISVQTYIALAFGFSLMVNAWVFYRISGGLFNPAVTLALVLIKAITPTRGVFVFAAQVAGGIAAAGLASCMFPTPLNVSTSLAPGVSLVQGVFIEAILTFELVFTIFMLAAEKHRATFVAPVGIGLALFIAELGGVYYTGGSLNPARSLGPCVIAVKFESEHWIYWVGPLIGALVAVGLYKAIKALQYEAVNPGQDSHQ